MNPQAKPSWKHRCLGLDTSINHTSAVQVNGLQWHLKELSKVFNNSPLAKNEGLHFSPDNFAYWLIGTSGDHAADQKKSHKMLWTWHLDVVLQRLSKEALMGMDPTQVVAMLIALKAQQIKRRGGQDTWDTLCKDEQTEAYWRLCKSSANRFLTNCHKMSERSLPASFILDVACTRT